MTKKVLRISIPGFNGEATLSQYLDYEFLERIEWEVHLNSGPDEIDAWFVIEDVEREHDFAYVSPQNIFYGTAETARPYGYLSESKSRIAFLQQFAHIFSHHDLYLENAHPAIPFLPWMVNSNHGASMMMDHKRNLSFLRTTNLNQKVSNPLISVFCSTQKMTPGHRLRLRFTEELKKHFGSELVWYGNGIRSVPEKWDGLAPFKYTVVMENHVAHNVITEKVQDAFICETFPFYWGAPNLKQYFHQDGFIEINILDLRGSIEIIEEALNSGVSTQARTEKALATNRDLALNKYNFVNRIFESFFQWGNFASEKQPIELRPSIDFRSREEKLQQWIINRGASILRNVR